jgi:gliding motility-associated-like protein
MGFTYLWNFNAGNTPITPAPTYAVGELSKAQPAVLYNKEGTYQVSLKVTTSEGCIDSLVKPFIINGSNPIAHYTVLKDTALCSNEEVIIKDSSWVYPGSIGKLHIEWGDGLSTIIENPTLNNQYKHLYSSTSSLNYAIKVNAYSGGTCVDDSITNINLVIPPTNFSIAAPTTPYLCINDTLHLIPELTGGTAPFSYEFSTDNANASIINNIITGLQKGLVNVNVNVKDAKNCLYTYTNSVSFNLPKLPIASFFANDTVICNGDSLSLKGIGGETFKWYRDGNLEYTNIFDSLRIGNAGNYTLIVNDGQCNSLPSDAIKIIEFEIPKISFEYNPISCTNGQLAITTDAVDKNKIHYNWNFGDGASSTLPNPLTHNYTKKGDYVITLNITNDYCSRYDTLMVGDTVKVIEPVSPKKFTLFLLAEMDTLLSPLKIDSGYTIYNWAPTRYLSNPFIATPIFNGPGSNGRSLEYVLTRINPITSCEVADIYNLDISNDVVVAVPKAFTPNGDNLNDILKLEFGAGLKSLLTFKIFNRWGNIVFSTQEIREGWNGKVNGIDQEMDAYTYFIEYINYKDERLRKKGTFALLR